MSPNSDAIDDILKLLNARKIKPLAAGTVAYIPQKALDEANQAIERLIVEAQMGAMKRVIGEPKRASVDVPQLWADGYNNHRVKAIKELKRLKQQLTNEEQA